MNNRCKAPDFSHEGMTPARAVFYATLYGIILVVIFMIIGAAHAQPKHEHSGVDGQFYSQWKILPDRANSCCNFQDCYFTMFKTEDGKTFALRRKVIDQATLEREPVAEALIHPSWVAIPKEKLEENAKDPMDSPDGQNHVCLSDTYDYVICAVRGTGQ